MQAIKQLHCRVARLSGCNFLNATPATGEGCRDKIVKHVSVERTCLESM